MCTTLCGKPIWTPVYPYVAHLKRMLESVSIEQLCLRLNKPESWVHDLLALDNLPEPDKVFLRLLTELIEGPTRMERAILYLRDFQASQQMMRL